MYCLALFFLALAAFAAGSGYVPGREYVYRYRGHVSAGFPDKKPQYSGLVYDARLHIQPHEGDYSIFKVEGKHYKTFNGDTTKKEKQPYNYEDLPPRSDYQPAPFKVHFKDGQVTKFQTFKSEPAFSTNLKRALISLFHITFEPTDSQSQSTRENEIYKPDYGEHYYKTMEDGVLGHCETQYVIEHLPYYKSPENNIVLNITKTRNYHKCDLVPDHYYSTFYGEECGQTEQDKAHTIHGNAFIHYDIRGDRHHYVIEKITAEGDVGFTPYPLEGQTAEIYVNRTLELIEEKDSVTEEYHVNDDDAEYHTDLEYVFDYKPKFKAQIDLKAPHYLYHIYGKKTSMDQIRELFAKLIHVYDDETYHEAAATKERDYPAIFLELVKSVGSLGYDDIAELYKEFADFTKEEATSDKLLTKNLFFDVLINTGTNPSLIFGKNLVKSGKVPEELVLYFLQQIPYHIKEFTQALLDEGYDLCRHDFIVQRPRLYTACYLQLADIIHDRCVARYHPEGDLGKDEYSCPDDVPQTFFNEISKKYEESEDEYRKIAYITALGQLGIKDSLRYLRHYVEGDSHQNLLDRSNAIYALSTIARRYPEMVRELIIPLYYNTSENYQVRIAAFNILLITHPELYELETIARNLIDDKDDQVRSYVYSTFRSYDNSTHPCDLKLAHDVRYALSILKPYRREFDRYDYTYSQHHYTSGYNKDYGYGGSTRFAYLASDTGYIPRSMYFQVNDFMRGKSFDTFAVGFRQYGLEKFTDRLLSPEATAGKRSVFDLFKKRKARDVSNVDKERREIQEKLHLPTKEYPHVDGELFFTYMGNHFSFMYFNETTFESFLKEGAFEIPDLPSFYKNVPKYRFQRFIMPLDLVYIFPSESGLPIVMDFKLPAYYYHKNDKLKVEVNPAFFREDRQDQLPTDVHVNVEGHFVFDKQFIGSVGVIQSLDHTTIGAGIERRSTISLPIKVEIDVDIKEHDLKIKWKPVVQHQIYHFEFEPYTFIDSFDDNLAVVDEAEYHPVRRMGYHKQVVKEIKLEPFGLKLHVDKDYDNEWDDYGSLFTFIMRENFRDKFYYLTTNPQLEPYKYDVILENADGEEITEVDYKLDYHFYHDENKHSSSLSENGFETHGDARSDQHFLTSVLHGEIVAHGHKEHKLQAELTYSRDLFRTYHKLNLYYDRTPFYRGEEEGHLKVCASGYLKYPKIDYEKLSHFKTDELHLGVDSEIKAHFGKDCTSDQKVTVKAHFDRTEEQLDLDHRREEHENHEHNNPYAYLYQKCIHDQGHGDIYPMSCVDYILQVFKLNKYSFDIKYEHLSPRFMNMTQKVDEFLRHELYDHSDTRYIHGPEGEAHVEVNVSAVYQVADIRVRIPSRESHYTHIHVPDFKSFNSYPVYQDIMIRKSVANIYCKVMGDVVDTFDKYSYVLPQIDCYKVISKDCSPRESFLVLGKKLNHPKYKKALKVFIGHHKVEMLPLSDDSELVVRVDGKKVPVTETEPYIHYEKQRTDPVFYVGLREYGYALYSEQYKLVVEYDGNFISVALSPYYRAKLCGLCGDYNGQKHDGYINEHGCLENDDAAYAYSYAIPSETCSVPKIEKECHEEGGFGCTELKTQVLQINKGKVPQTCFSTEPIPHCRSDCTAQGHFKRMISYHCLPAKDDSTKHLLAESETRVLYEIRRKSKDHEGEVEVDEGCHRS